jgi:hypothetical protein
MVVELPTGASGAASPPVPTPNLSTATKDPAFVLPVYKSKPTQPAALITESVVSIDHVEGSVVPSSQNLLLRLFPETRPRNQYQVPLVVAATVEDKVLKEVLYLATENASLNEENVRWAVR